MQVFYTDPALTPDETCTVLFPSISYDAITIGTGYKRCNIILDNVLEYLIGKEREITASTAHNVPGTHNMNIFAGSFGIGYEF